MMFRRVVTALQMAWAERGEMSHADLSKHDLQFMPSELELINTPISPAPRAISWAIVSIASLGLVWSCFGKTDLVATAEGKIVSATHTKVVQPLSSGIVKQILVQDGQSVKSGQDLIVLDATEASADQVRIYEQWKQSRLSQLRTDALLESIKLGKLIPMKRDDRIDGDSFGREKLAAESQWIEQDAKLSSLRAVAEQKLAAARENLAEIAKLSNTLPLVKQRESDYQRLAAEKFVSEHALQDRKTQRIQVEGDLASLKQRSGELNAAIHEASAQIQTAHAEFRAKLAKENSETAAASAQLEQELNKARAVAKKMILTSPVDGVVQQLAVHTVGGVVTPAQPLLQVVPIGEKVIVEAWIQNKDIGFVSQNQKVEIKIETFEHTKYGTVPARVLSVSSDAVQDDKKGLGYIARIQLDRPSLQVGNRLVNLGPGLSVTSEIHIGTKRIIEYLLSPMLEAATAAVPR